MTKTAFEFYPTNHSVVRGALDYPCIPYEKVIPEVDGFFAGFHPVKTIPKDVSYLHELL